MKIIKLLKTVAIISSVLCISYYVLHKTKYIKIQTQKEELSIRYMIKKNDYLNKRIENLNIKNEYLKKLIFEKFNPKDLDLKY